MNDLLIKLARILTNRHPNNSPGVARNGEYSLGDDLYRDQVDSKQKVKKALKKTKGEGKFEDLVINTLDTGQRSGNNAAPAAMIEPPARGLDS